MRWSKQKKSEKINISVINQQVNRTRAHSNIFLTIFSEQTKHVLQFFLSWAQNSRMSMFFSIFIGDSNKRWQSMHCPFYREYDAANPLNLTTYSRIQYQIHETIKYAGIQKFKYQWPLIRRRTKERLEKRSR